MEEEIEDIVGDVKLTDSQKSVATSNVYSIDFTDSSSDRNNSSGKDTYVIEHYDSDDSDLYPIHEDKTVIDLKDNKQNRDAHIQCEVTNKITRTASTSVHNCIVAQEIFTQTSKTIFELAQTEGVNKETLETQTSFISFTENRTFEYRIDKNNSPNINTVKNYDKVLTDTLENESSKFQASEPETVNKSEENSSEVSSGDRIIYILDTESKENVLSDENHETQYENTSDFEESYNSDIEQDSLIEIKNDVDIENVHAAKDVRNSVDSEIEDLYSKLTGKFELLTDTKTETERQYRTLTPLTEESTIKRESLMDITVDDINDIENSLEDSDKNFIHPNSAGGKVKMLQKEEHREELRLPPIQNRSCPNSPHLNFLFSVHPSNKLAKAGTLPCLYEATEKGRDIWDSETKNLACGECPLINGRIDPIPTNGSIHLPPIHIEGFVVNSQISRTDSQLLNNRNYTHHAEGQHDAISIKEKIKDLKMTKGGKSRTQSKYNISSESRSGSPSSGESPDETKMCDTAERGCEALCVEMLRRLRSNSWFEVSDTLDEIPKVMEKFWGIIAENRIADLIRQVSAQVDSPRTQVARIACNTLAAILKNTNYTKKPDFYEAMTLLLTKTGSFSRPVRRAANVALDAVVCGVDLSHSVTALSIHGVEHKSPLVRCAAARLLVVSCALGGGGREVLRARPPTAASARRHTLRALAALLNDKNTDARKYAERLYAMLRPLSNFEAYYLTDVDVELATSQMKKYDRLLLCGPGKDAR